MGGGGGGGGGGLIMSNTTITQINCLMAIQTLTGCQSGSWNSCDDWSDSAPCRA